MAGSLLPLAKQIALDNSANPGVGWEFYTYEPGTLTQKDTYQDAALTTPNVWPVVANARGEVTMYGSGLYRVILKDASGNTIYDRDNVGTVGAAADALRSDLSASTGSALVGWILSASSAVKRWLSDKLAERVSVKDFGAVGDGVTDDTAAIQAAINSRGNDQVLYFPKPSSSYLITSTLTMKTRVHLIGEGRFGSGILGDFDGPLMYCATQLWRTQIKNLSFKNNNAGANAGCVKGTFYQADIEDCQFEATNGFGLYLDSADYAVENQIRKNYFYHCKYGIRAPGGASYQVTDAYVVDNIFAGTSGVVNHIVWGISSGSVFRGNHFYGAASRYYMEMNSGLNVDVDGNYFESHANARIYIAPGNPGSWNIRGNRFWGGDGANVDLNGVLQSIIELSVTAGLSQRINIAGNLFEGGANSVYLVRTNANFSTNGFSTLSINFSDDNILRGTYTLGANVFRVDCGLRLLDRVISTAGQSIGMAGSIDRYTYTGATTDTVFLPDSATNNNMDNRTIRVYNDTASTVVTISTSSPWNGSKRIFPGGCVELQNRSGTWYCTTLSRGPVLAYSTANRPSGLGTADAGFTYYASGLVTPRMVVWNGSAYQDYAGTVV